MVYNPGMASQTTLNPIISFPEVLRARKPKALFETRLIALLVKRLNELAIIWSPKAFRGGLNNPQLPHMLLRKLESLIILGENLNWQLSKPLKNELDSTIEDIETFNPPFIESLRRASADIKRGKFITQRELEKRYGIK